MAEELAGAIVMAATTLQQKDGPHAIYACVYSHTDSTGSKFGVRGISDLEQINFKFMENLLLAAATKGYLRISGSEADNAKEYFDGVNKKVGRNREVLTVLKLFSEW